MIAVYTGVSGAVLGEPDGMAGTDSGFELVLLVEARLVTKVVAPCCRSCGAEDGGGDDCLEPAIGRVVEQARDDQSAG